jgi:hypothetical protein
MEKTADSRIRRSVWPYETRIFSLSGWGVTGTQKVRHKFDVRRREGTGMIVMYGMYGMMKA